jgi:putative ABC transport system substrate-binding protein
MVLPGVAAALQTLGVAAQQPMPVVGCLFIAVPERSDWWLEAWRKGLAESGFVEGRNLAVEYRYAKGDVTRLPDFAADLVARRVAVIVTTTLPAIDAAKQATTTIPIVFTNVSDPVGKGLVKSIARPGGNITGIARFVEGELEAKVLQLLHEIMPSASRIGYLVVGKDAAPRRGEMNAVAAAGKIVGVEVVLLEVDTLEEIDAAFGAARQRDIGAVLVQNPSTFLYAQTKRVLEAAIRSRLPVASGLVGFAEAGGLMSYRPGGAEAPYLTGHYVARILKGENPAELPVQQTTKTTLVINLRTAKALGLSIPPAILARADEVIE